MAVVERQFIIIVKMIQCGKLGKIAGKVLSEFGTRKLAESKVKVIELHYLIRAQSSVEDILNLMKSREEDIKKYCRTSVLEILNDNYIDCKDSKDKEFKEIMARVNQFENCNLYELSMQLAINRKMMVFLKPEDKEEHALVYNNILLNCIEMIKQPGNTLQDSLNFLFVYRVYEFEELYREVLKLFSRNIHQVDLKSENYFKAWAIMLNQFDLSEWAFLSEFSPILEFICDEFTVSKNSRYLKDFLKIFEEITNLKLHLVGPKRIPKCLKEILNEIFPMIHKLQIVDLCTLLIGFSKLPVQFERQFHSKVRERLLTYERSPVLESSRLPIHLMSEKELQKVFAAENTYKILWKIFLYYSEIPMAKKFFKPTTRRILRQCLLDILNHQSEVFTLPKTLSRVACVAYMLTIYYGDEEIRQKSIEFFKFVIQRVGLRHALTEFSFTNTLNLLYLLEEPQYETLHKEISGVLQINLYYRTIKLLDINKKQYLNIKIAVVNHINSPSRQVREEALSLLNILLKKYNDFDFAIYAHILFSIMSATHLEAAKRQSLMSLLLGKLKPGQDKILTEYLILSEDKDNLQVSEMFKFLNQSNANIEIALLLASSVPVSYMTNRYGEIEPELKDCMKDSKLGDLHVSTSNLNQITRSIEVLSNFVKLNYFVSSLYLKALESIDLETMGDEWQPREKSTRLIVEFLYKFQLIIDSKDLRQSSRKNILKKVYNVLERLRKFDHEIYLKIRYVDFLCLFGAHIKAKAGLEIDELHKVQKAISISSDPSRLSEVAFILVKLYCLEAISLPSSEVSEYISILSTSIAKKRLTLLTVKNEVTHILHMLNEEKVSSQSKEKLRRTVYPLIEEAINASDLALEMKVGENFIRLCLSLGMPNEAVSIMDRVLEGDPNPNDIVLITTLAPFKHLSAELMDKLGSKIREKAQYFSQNIVQILYFYEKNLLEVPGQVQTLLFQKVEEKLKRSISKIKKEKMDYDSQAYLLGRYTLYMFSCIKTGRTKGDVFQFLLQHVVNNQKSFRQLIRSPQSSLRLVNNCILAYARSEKGNRSSTALNIGTSNLQNNSDLEKLLEEKGISFEFKKQFRNVIAPYLLPDSKEIILLRGEDSNDAEGMMKFKAEICKKVCGAGVKVFEGGELREI